MRRSPREMVDWNAWHWLAFVLVGFGVLSLFMTDYGAVAVGAGGSPLPVSCGTGLNVLIRSASQPCLDEHWTMVAARFSVALGLGLAAQTMGNRKYRARNEPIAV